MTSSSGTQQASLPAAGRYRLDPAGSSVTFRTRHMFGLGRVTGSMDVVAGDITVDPVVPQASMTAAVSAASLHTGNRRRDRDVRSAKFLDIARYPHITFRAGTLVQFADHWMLAGDLTVRQVSRPVTLAIESARPVATGFRARATACIDRYAFGVTAAKGLAARYLDITLTVSAEPW